MADSDDDANFKLALCLSLQSNSNPGLRDAEQVDESEDDDAA